MKMAHEHDILVVATLVEARHYPQFAPRQVVTLSSPHRVRGRAVRNAWYSPLAADGMTSELIAGLMTALSKYPREGAPSERYFHVEDWQPEPPDFMELIAALPSQNAAGSRDFGRGYSKAVKDVLALLAEHLAVE